jgi:hypothetical protein
MRYQARLVLFGMLLSSAAWGQVDDLPERTTVSELLMTPAKFDGQTVMVKGDLRSGSLEDEQQNVFRLRGKTAVREIRVGPTRSSMNELRFLVGQDVEITGIFWDLASQCYEAPMSGVQCYDHRIREFGAVTRDFNREEKRYFIGVLAADLVDDQPLPEEPEIKESPEPEDIDIAPGDLIDLRDLVKNPEPYLNRRVSVIGKFRGNDLYDDLSIQSKKTPRDFVIKVADAAIWVTGRRPRGKGFKLNPKMRRDTGKWLKVIGVPWMADEMVYVKAEKIELTDKPDDPELEPVKIDRAALEAEKEPPPEVAFTIPLDGESGIPLDSDFRVQFSNDMNPASFDRNVDLLYADDDGLGNPFPEMQIRYEDANRTLVVLPGKTLEPGKEVQLILYNGIVDENGKPLLVHSTELEFPDVAVAFKFYTGNR